MKQILEAKMSDGHLIYVMRCIPTDTPIGHVHLMHGLAEHIERYDEFVDFLVDKGFIVSGHDHRGHGKTAVKNGQLGYFADRAGFERITEDVREVLLTVREGLTNLPLILFGHSMGSFVARRYMQKYSDSLSKVILSGSAYDPGVLGNIGKLIGKAASKIKTPQAESPLLNSLAFGGFNKKVAHPETPFDWLTRDGEEVRKYIEDPLCGFIPSNQLYVDMFGGMRAIHKESEIMKVRKGLPVLMISGAKDPVGKDGKDVFKVAEGMKKVGMKNITVQLIEDARHELLKELGKEQTMEFIYKWMMKDE
ncbi:alpha/beta hydrolase [Psychrobacillus sp. MER TA 171]|uniref:alpha/beta fold hydrolase n=1 Tax=Psychrobacillus sp. MER TA 171 TaxID=2939577 RepID=UPI00203CBC1A|nr:alpha/beta hydrolase [Psychrobacillus sp. MER TA 171]